MLVSSNSDLMSTFLKLSLFVTPCKDLMKVIWAASSLCLFCDLGTHVSFTYFRAGCVVFVLCLVSYLSQMSINTLNLLWFPVISYRSVFISTIDVLLPKHIKVQTCSMISALITVFMLGCSHPIMAIDFVLLQEISSCSMCSLLYLGYLVPTADLFR
jgi:hypothetical protein